MKKKIKNLILEAQKALGKSTCAKKQIVYAFISLSIFTLFTMTNTTFALQLFDGMGNAAEKTQNQGLELVVKISGTMFVLGLLYTILHHDMKKIMGEIAYLGVTLTVWLVALLYQKGVISNTVNQFADWMATTGSSTNADGTTDSSSALDIVPLLKNELAVVKLNIQLFFI